MATWYQYAKDTVYSLFNNEEEFPAYRTNEETPMETANYEIEETDLCVTLEYKKHRAELVSKSAVTEIQNEAASIAEDISSDETTISSCAEDPVVQIPKPETEEEKLTRHKKDLLQKCVQVIRPDNVGSLPYIYQLPLSENYQDSNQRTVSFGDFSSRPMKTILVIGATGAGKSTLINAFINYVLNVSWKDEFRFRLIEEPFVGGSQAFSQTSAVTAYKIYHQVHHRVPYSLTIIDTPGFGDTNGIQRDKAIFNQLSEFFKSGASGVYTLDAVGFVAESTRSRLTTTQTYIFNSILSIFGRDIADNIFMLLTFADGQKPPILSALSESQLPFKDYFKFNNSALFANNQKNKDEDDFDFMFWKMGATSYKKFLTELRSTETKSLTMTKEVLLERERLERTVEGIQQQITSGLRKLDQLKFEIDILFDHEADIRRNKKFKYTVPVEETIKIMLDPGTYVTNCLKCNRTCHFPCAYANDQDKKRCAAMEGDMDTDNRTCCVCPGKCVWTVHHNMEYRFDFKTTMIEKTAEDLKKRYEIATGKKMSHEQLINNVIADMEATELSTASLANDVRKSIERLQEIALKPNPLSTVDYIDVLIETERSQKKSNWKNRMIQLEAVRKQAQTMADISRPNFDPYQAYKTQLVEEKKKGNKNMLIDACASIKKYFNKSEQKTKSE